MIEERWDFLDLHSSERAVGGREAKAKSAGVWWGVVVFRLFVDIFNLIHKLEGPAVTVTLKQAAVLDKLPDGWELCALLDPKIMK